jgi:hypothetical protein
MIGNFVDAINTSPMVSTTDGTVTVMFSENEDGELGYLILWRDAKRQQFFTDIVDVYVELRKVGGLDWEWTDESNEECSAP